MKTFTEFLNEESIFWREKMNSSMVIVFTLGNFNIDDKMLDIIGDSDCSCMHGGKVYMFFKDREKSENVFKELSKLWGYEIKNSGAMKTFIGDAGFSAELKSSELLKESEGINEAFFSKPSWVSLAKKGFVKTNTVDVKNIANSALLSEVYDVKQFRDLNGNTMWLKGPSKDTKVFRSRAEAEEEYNPSRGFYIDEPSAYLEKEDVVDIKNTGALILIIPSKKELSSWEVLIARVLDTNY